MMANSQDELQKRASSGDQEALSELLGRIGPTVRERLAPEIPRRWRSVLAVDDVMQQTFIDAFLDIGRFSPQGAGALPRWLTTVARNNLRNAIDALEAEKRGGGRRRVEPHNPDDSMVALYELLGATQSTPSGHAALTEARSDLERAMNQLPEDYRRVVQLYDLERRSTEEVAGMLGRRSGAMFMLRARAHRALRELMGGSSKYFSTSS